MQIDLKLAQENFKRWNDALLSEKAEKVAELYTDDATFLPTLSPDFKIGKKDAVGYFEHFLEKKPIGKIVDEEIQPISETSYLHSGMYNFEIGPAYYRQIAEARFTYLWVLKNGEWKIAHHHSSIKPKK